MRAAGWRLSWAKFQKYLEEVVGEIWQTHFFASEHRPPKENQRNFYNMLKYQLGFELHLGETKQKTIYVDLNNGSQKEHTIYLDKGLDVRLVTWMLKLLLNEAYDTAILLSGYGDYVDAVQTIRDAGCRVELIGWKNSVSKDLEELASNQPILYLDDLRSEIERDEEHLL
jgi:uncharacterized LabA/DUF88 family protein